MNPYWNYVATPYLFLVILFGMFVLFSLQPGYFSSGSTLQATVAAVAVSSNSKGIKKSKPNPANGIAAITAVAAGNGKPQ